MFSYVFIGTKRSGGYFWWRPSFPWSLIAAVTDGGRRWFSASMASVNPLGCWILFLWKKTERKPWYFHFIGRLFDRLAGVRHSLTASRHPLLFILTASYKLRTIIRHGLHSLLRVYSKLNSVSPSSIHQGLYYETYRSCVHYFDHLSGRTWYSVVHKLEKIIHLVERPLGVGFPWIKPYHSTTHWKGQGSRGLSCRGAINTAEAEMGTRGLFAPPPLRKRKRNQQWPQREVNDAEERRIATGNASDTTVIEFGRAGPIKVGETRQKCLSETHSESSRWNHQTIQDPACHTQPE